MVVRSALLMTGQAHWKLTFDEAVEVSTQSGELALNMKDGESTDTENAASPDDINQLFFENYVESNFEVVIYAIFGFGIVLDLVCIKYRKVAKCLFYYECVLVVLMAFLPFE